MAANNRLNHPRRILVFRIGELGDTLIALPALRAIRRQFPEAEISLLGNADSEGRHVTPQQLLPVHGLIDHWLAYPSTNSQASLADQLRLLRRLRRNDYDLLVYLAPRIRHLRDVKRDLWFFRLAGITNVIGHHGLVPLPQNSEGCLPDVEHETDHLLQRLAQSGIPVPAPGKAAFDLELAADERRIAADWLRDHTSFFPESSLVAFGPGSKWPSKVWPEERYAAVGKELISNSDVFPIVFGGVEDRELGERLIEGWGRGANAAGALSVRESAAALGRCRMYIGNDTGTMHLAAAAGTRCVVLMSALDWPGHWNPYGEGHTVLRRQVPCEGCLLRVCEKEEMRCLKEITVDEVVAACEVTLGNKRRKEQSDGNIARLVG